VSLTVTAGRPQVDHFDGVERRDHRRGAAALRAYAGLPVWQVTELAAGVFALLGMWQRPHGRRRVTGMYRAVVLTLFLRDLADAAECYPHAKWPMQIADALRDLVHATNTARQAGQADIDEHLREARLDWIRAAVAVGLSEVDRNPNPKGKQPPGRCLLEMLRDRLGDVVRFARDLKVPPTSNQAERDVRPAKTQQKISGRLTSEDVTRDRYRIHGYLSTAAKHGIDQLAALRDALLGRPWLPTPPAPA
jgi:transposase